MTLAPKFNGMYPFSALGMNNAVTTETNEEQVQQQCELLYKDTFSKYFEFLINTFNANFFTQKIMTLYIARQGGISSCVGLQPPPGRQPHKGAPNFSCSTARDLLIESAGQMEPGSIIQNPERSGQIIPTALTSKILK